MERDLSSLQVGEKSVNELQGQILALQPEVENSTSETETAMGTI
jgi:hypothetical protein